MNPVWLTRNIKTSWRHRASVLDFFRRLIWLYSGSLPVVLRKREWTIGFRYPLPVGGIRLLLRANAGSDNFIHSEVFDHEYYHLPLAAPPATILDLGANAGLTAVYFGRIYPKARLACVEPVPDNLRVLARNLDLNTIESTLIPAAADVKDGRVLMDLGGMDYGHKVADPAKGPPGSSVEVAALTIPSILRRLGWDRVGLLKMDIEGHEKALFSASCEWLDLVDVMCIECHEGFGEEDLAEIALKHGFMRPERLPGMLLVRRVAA